MSLNVEGLYLADAIRPKVSLSTQNQIKAIMSVAAQKNHQKVEGGEIRRRIEVTERAMMRARDAGSKRRSLAAILEQVVERAISDQPISFSALAKAADLDPARDFVGETLVGVDLRGEDLRGFNFSNADL